MVEDQFDLDLFSGNLYAFCNRRQDIVKILYWSESGFCVWMKKLEKESFRWPKSEKEALEVSQIALSWLLHGLDLNQAHQQLNYTSVGWKNVVFLMKQVKFWMQKQGDYVSICTWFQTLQNCQMTQ